MSKWSKKTFIDHLNQSCESDVAMHCIELVDFSEKISEKLVGEMERILVR